MKIQVIPGKEAETYPIKGTVWVNLLIPPKDTLLLQEANTVRVDTHRIKGTNRIHRKHILTKIRAIIPILRKNTLPEVTNLIPRSPTLIKVPNPILTRVPNHTPKKVILRAIPKAIRKGAVQEVLPEVLHQGALLQEVQAHHPLPHQGR